jgi:hypothetical protein
MSIFDAAKAYTMFEEWYELCLEHDIDPKEIIAQDRELTLITNDGDLLEAYEQYKAHHGIVEVEFYGRDTRD